jgi:peptidoglycan/LPS O-acetylase OafA/YrhL
MDPMTIAVHPRIPRLTLAAEAKYRPDIDGLRALAVLSVVLYHADVPGISGGFIGVDVFFVISGFLITSQLVSFRNDGFRSLLTNFYARRARRILPSLTIVTATTLLLGWILLLPDGDQQDLAKSAIASALFASNLFFWVLKKDYFAGSTELQPLLHTWSLSVEEQYYLILPVVLLVLWTIERTWLRRPNSLVRPTLMILSAASLGISAYWVATDQPAAFFLLPSRFWELGTGATLGLSVLAVNRLAFAGALRLLGLLAIVLPVIIYTPHTPFPGFAAVVPVAGTALVISAGIDEQRGLLCRLLTSPPMLATGKISYAWYLWHWPLLALARAVGLGTRNIARDLLLIALAYALAYLSTHFFETPIRQKRIPPFASSSGSVRAGLIVVLVMALLPIPLWYGAYSKYHATYGRLWWPSVSCLTSYQANELQPNAACILSQGAAGTVFLVGDSHASHWSPAVAEWATKADIYALERSTIGCDVLLLPEANQGLVIGTNLNYPARCMAFSKSILEIMNASAATRKPAGVVLSANWLLPRYGGSALLKSKLQEGLTYLARIGMRALIIAPSPIFPFSVPKCVGYRGTETCRILRTDYDAATKALTDDLQLLVKSHRNAHLWTPTSQFCDLTWCYTTAAGSLLFSDNEHISDYAARRAEPSLEPELNWLIERTTHFQ